MNLHPTVRSACAALLSAALAGTAQAAVLTVNNLDDSGSGSLRDAVSAANPGDTIAFAPGLNGRIVVATPLVLARNLSIAGNGAVALDGNDASQVLQIQNGVTVALDDLIIQHGYGTLGGGIHAGGYVTLTRCTLRANHASYGGGLFVESLPGSGYAMADSFVIDNDAAGPGGGIYDAGQSASSIVRSEISGNLSLGSGGGVTVSSGRTLVVDHSTIAGNQSAAVSPTTGGGIAVLGGSRMDISYSTVSANKAYYGGGIHIDPAGTVNLTASLVAGNTAESHGGGLFVFGGSLVALNATIANNVAAIAAGGGITLQNSSASTASVKLSSSTVAYNRAATNGGGLSVITGSVSLQYTLMAGNAAPANPDLQAAFVSLGMNLVQTRGSSSGYAASDLPAGSDPKLGLLAFNGGPTDTLSLQAGSAAADVIPAAKCAAIPLDQRGYRRLGPSCDIGAFEAGAIGDTVFSDGFE